MRCVVLKYTHRFEWLDADGPPSPDAGQDGNGLHRPGAYVGEDSDGGEDAPARAADDDGRSTAARALPLNEALIPVLVPLADM